MLKLSLGVSVRKNTRAHVIAVHGTTCINRLIAEQFTDCRYGASTTRSQAFGNLVCIENGDAVRQQVTRNSALTTADTACEPPNRVSLHACHCDPKNRHSCKRISSPPIARKGPNGRGSCARNDWPLWTARMIQKAAPVSAAKNKIHGRLAQPNHAPKPASNLASPPPKPTRCVRRR